MKFFNEQQKRNAKTFPGKDQISSRRKSEYKRSEYSGAPGKCIFFGEKEQQRNERSF